LKAVKAKKGSRGSWGSGREVARPTSSVPVLGDKWWVGIVGSSLRLVWHTRCTAPGIWHTSPLLLNTLQ